jgi:hypothetical protein
MPAASMIDTLRAGASGSGAGGSILRNGLRETPPQRTVPQIPVPPYPLTSYEKELNVSRIFQMARDQKYGGPVTGEKSTKHKKKLDAYMFNVATAISQFEHSDRERLEYMCALAHLEGDANDLVIEWSAKNKRVCTMEKIFSLLTDQCKLVELDVMDIAAEVDTTTAHTVALAIQREVRPSGKVSIQPVMRGLTNAIAMRDGLLQGEGRFDLISRCRFLLAAFTPAEGVPGREWLITMREQAHWTPDENNLRKCQMDPKKMIEQLTACGDWWDKFAKNLSSQSKRGADDAPFQPVGKKPKGGGGGSAYGASGYGYGYGGAQRENRQERGRPQQRDNRRDGSRGDSWGGGSRDGDHRKVPPAPDFKKVTFGRGKEDDNPFLLKYHTSPTYLPKHSI